MHTFKVLLICLDIRNYVKIVRLYVFIGLTKIILTFSQLTAIECSIIALTVILTALFYVSKDLYASPKPNNMSLRSPRF